ncbi:MULTISPECIES: hypothetical protein [Paracoccus]|uniref:hypothetical protein n=1 Tax=Paracoccus TaxID=265 RepID=UPI000DB96C1D|nr:hypothetical protein [Paracoccus sediminilitoris]
MQSAEELSQVEAKTAGLLTAIKDGMYHSSKKAKMEALEARKAGLNATLAEALQDHMSRPAVTGILRGLIREIRMVPEAAAPGGHHVELLGERAGILGLT